MIGSGSIGVPCPGADVRIVNPDGTEAADDQPGEIVVRAPGLMRGYLNKPEETAETFRGGWLHTGDLGRRDAAGYLYFVGRIKDVIRRAGENIAAAEVETVLRVPSRACSRWRPFRYRTTCSARRSRFTFSWGTGRVPSRCRPPS